MTRRRPHLVLELAALALGFVFILPMLGIVNVALKDRRNTSGAFAISGSYTLANIATAWNQGKLAAALANSAFIAVASVILIVLVGAVASYPLARIGARWSNGVFYTFLAGLIIPGQLGLLPLFKSIAQINLVGSPWSVILINLGGGMPFTIFLFTTFMRELPLDFEHAAAIDGCGPINTFRLVVFPMMRPAIGTVVILNLIAIWNNFLTPLLYLTGSGHDTVPVRINSFVGQYSTNWPVVFAALVITSAPILGAFLALQRYVISGFAGGLKG